MAPRVESSRDSKTPIQTSSRQRTRHVSSGGCRKGRQRLAAQLCKPQRAREEMLNHLHLLRGQSRQPSAALGSLVLSPVSFFVFPQLLPCAPLAESRARYEVSQAYPGCSIHSRAAMALMSLNDGGMPPPLSRVVSGHTSPVGGVEMIHSQEMISRVQRLGPFSPLSPFVYAHSTLASSSFEPALLNSVSSAAQLPSIWRAGGCPELCSADLAGPPAVTLQAPPSSQTCSDAEDLTDSEDVPLFWLGFALFCLPTLLSIVREETQTAA
ncbi:predicted protein [Chaetomium globosum CBS 148.51]|uniref:Uncharacterized protein n=1 Tax=Chaetomium globosum (strain ATCC 6205 / CBS 148.51 / DSM 1962 / NBRC 6347 / NRRL 1970) TaxID=306901 RepID=Q2GXZ1_CHAGB|nr:uncharacterized protein CHGG_07163 [Chaetomium globosum CBS 148.51]EAQ85910.1 predicted protein [Chaetomium globosum CBS 148.51]